MKPREALVFVLMLSILTLKSQADNSKEDDGVPKDEISPFDYLPKPDIGLTAGVAAGTLSIMTLLAVCVYAPYPRIKN